MIYVCIYAVFFFLAFTVGNFCDGKVVTSVTNLFKQTGFHILKITFQKMEACLLEYVASQ